MKDLSKPDSKVDNLLNDLQERAKELNCLYKIEELLNNADAELSELFAGVIEIIPAGWQFPEVCQVKIEYKDQVYSSTGFRETPWNQSTDIAAQEKVMGRITVSYSEKVPETGSGLFLNEERKLIDTIADRIGHTILQKSLREIFKEWKEIKEELSEKKGSELRAVIDMLERSDRKLFLYVSQKMLYHLCWNNIKEAKKLLEKFGVSRKTTSRGVDDDDVNRPVQKQTIDRIISLSHEVFRVAAKSLNEEQILANIQKWVQEDKSRFLVKVIDNSNSTLNDIIDALTRYHYIEAEGATLSDPIEKGLRVSLIRRFFADQLEFINIAKKFIEVRDFYDLSQRMVFTAESQGQLGGKSAGLFLAAHIAAKSPEHRELFKNLKVPRTWYLTSDGLINFLHYNNLEEINEQKYKSLDEIYLSYLNIVQIFKNSNFPPEVIKGLSTAIEDFGDHPIIVRSSSLLEDRFGAVFSGKYKSLFLANQGSKEERLNALLDAVAEVYASTFAPDPIEYRTVRGLIDFNEEMGIMIQEVVGTKVGRYFFPVFAGVAFSKNAFFWSSRIKKEDGLIRMVPGLGTRAVDRVTDDYPVLIAPGMPDLRVNVSPGEVLRYSAKRIDVINLEDNSFETVEIAELLKEFGSEIPGIQHIVSTYIEGHIENPTSKFNINFNSDDLVVTFHGIIKRTPFVEQIDALLKLLEDKMGTAVDIEFAHNGESLYLLQCRPQSYSKDVSAPPIPKDLPEEKIIFSARKFVTNGIVPNITHIVFIDSNAYSRLRSLEDLKKVGRSVGRLNKILPKRQFILMGPGRWGSRGDIKLGVNVTYADINNTAMLIEIACKKGNYTPELSFGTHFFQDLVEASIRYLPLYPDEEGVIFNSRFLLGTDNILADLLPEYSELSDTVRVIDVNKSMEGFTLQILMNGDLEEAVGFLSDSSLDMEISIEPAEIEERPKSQVNSYWRWRLHMAELIASRLDGRRFGVKGFYLLGSTKNATAGAASDIDILVHFRGTEKQRKELCLWLEGWSLSLAEMNYLRTGYSTDGLLDVHIITDKDVANKTSYAVKIGAVTDAARPLPLKSTI